MKVTKPVDGTRKLSAKSSEKMSSQKKKKGSNKVCK